MSDKFHVSDDGVVRPCSARVKECKYGEKDHYDSLEEARAGYEESMRDRLFNPIVKNTLGVEYDNDDAVKALVFFCSDDVYDRGNWVASSSVVEFVNAWTSRCLNIPRAPQVVKECYGGDASGFVHDSLAESSSSGVGFSDTQTISQDPRVLDLVKYHFSDYVLEQASVFDAKELEDDEDGVSVAELDGLGVDSLGSSPASRAFYRRGLQIEGERVEKAVDEFTSRVNRDGWDAHSIERHANQLIGEADGLVAFSQQGISERIDSGWSIGEARKYLDNVRDAARVLRKEGEWWREYCSKHKII